MPSSSQYIYIAPRFDKNVSREDKPTQRKNIEKQTNDFLMKGGNVTVVDIGKSGYEHLSLKAKSNKAKKATKVKPQTEKIV